jgi:phosphate transport system permease protein
MTVIDDHTRIPAGGLPAPVPLVLRTERSGSDRLYRGTAQAVGIGSLVLLGLIGLFLLIRAVAAFQSQGWRFFTNTGFVTEGLHPSFGVASQLFGTLVIALIAMVIAVPISIGAALCINEYLPVRCFGVPLRGFFTSLVDLMAAIPSVIYALWGFFILQPRMVGVSRWLSVHLGFIPIFKTTTPLYTSSAMIAGTLVGIMVMPIITSLSREVAALAPVGEREAALSLGASRAKVIRRVVLPFAKGGMVGATMLGLGRALGDTIAVAIIISPIYTVDPHILQAGAGSIAALIVDRFGSGGPLGLAALMACGLVLFFVTLVVNLVASWVVERNGSGRRRAA